MNGQIEEAAKILDRTNRGYLILLRNPFKEGEITGARLFTRTDVWPPCPHTTKEHDMLKAIACALSDGQEQDLFLVLNNAERNLILGALDTLGTALADKKHTWSEGERAVYEEAIRILKVKVEDSAADEITG